MKITLRPQAEDLSDYYVYDENEVFLGSFLREGDTFYYWIPVSKLLDSSQIKAVMDELNLINIEWQQMIEMGE